MFVHKTLLLENIPPHYFANDIVEEIWDSHLYDKLIPIKSGMTVVDVGASIGVFSIYASQKVGANGRIISFEPESTSWGALLDNIALNGVTNVQPVKMGMWNSGGTQNIKKDNGNLAASTMFSSEGESVQVDRLDKILPQMGITHVDFVKIDAEGAGQKILEGASGMMSQIDNFAIAAYHAPHENPRKMTEFLEAYGFRTKTLTRFGWSPYVYATRDTSINLAYVELWQVLFISGLVGLFVYDWSKKK